jgi:carbamoyl-phosphate synthase small subunit
MRQKCTLNLSNQLSFEGELIGAPYVASGEMVFTTGMVGYCEALSDPSYYGQILVFTYPLIGNYGIPQISQNLIENISSGYESSKVQASAAIIAVDSAAVFHWRSFSSLDQWLEQQGVPALVGMDTRHLVHTIRNNPKLLGRIEPQAPRGVRNMGAEFENWEQKPFFDPSEKQVIGQVSCQTPRLLGNKGPVIGLIDCGVKLNIIRQLLCADIRIQLIPWDHSFTDFDCASYIISNGPGDPRNTGEMVPKIRELMNLKKPMLGICLGHQLMGIAAGMTTTRMDYGHRSHNQPVYLCGTRQGFITSQNHGYVIDDSAISSDWLPWFRNVNDQTIEGLRHKTKPFRSVQFHPEAAGGPRETSWIIQDFIKETEALCQ